MNENLNYERLYIKYKEKYHRLKIELAVNELDKYNARLYTQKQIGGATSRVPDTLPETQSYVFMPIIYYAIDNESVQFFEGFHETIEECIKNVKELTSSSISNFNDFVEHLKNTLNSNNIRTLEDIKNLHDGDHHIPGEEQERITNYHRDEFINMIFSCITQMLVERYPGREFIYLK